MAAEVHDKGMNGPNAQPFNMFAVQAQNGANVEAFNKTVFDHNSRMLSGRHTRLGKKFICSAGTYGDVLLLELDASNNALYSRKQITLQFNPKITLTDGTAYVYDFLVTPNATKFTLYDQVTNFLLDFFTRAIDPKGVWLGVNYLNACKNAIINQATSPNFKSSVLATAGASPIERYIASRLLRYCDTMCGAILSEAENVWSYVEKIARSNGAGPKAKNKSNSKPVKSDLQKSIEKYRKDAAREEIHDKVVNNKETLVKTKAMRQFCSLFYITPASILETKIWYRTKLDEDARNVEADKRTKPTKEVNADLASILDYWKRFSEINETCANFNTEVYFPEVPFYILDADGLWDISKSLKKPTYKAVSLSSIAGLRMPFLMGYNWQGNAIDGDLLGYVITSARIDKEISMGKVNGLKAMEQAVINIARDLFHHQKYSLTSLKYPYHVVDKSVREYEREMGDNIPDEPLGPSYQYAQRFPPTQNTNRVAQEFKKDPKAAEYYDEARAAYTADLARDQAKYQINQQAQYAQNQPIQQPQGQQQQQVQPQ